MFGKVANMRAYYTEIPGRKHNQCEDSSFARQLKDKHGMNVGVYIIGDGLSGYEGAKASHLAVKSTGEKICDNISLQGIEASLEIVTRAIIETNETLTKLTQETRTTLDLVVVSAANPPLYAHLGDGRIYGITESQIQQLTIDESDGPKGPSNFLGEEYIYGRSIDKRIKIQILQKRPKALFLTTDGLRSRVPEQFIQRILQDKYHHPQKIIDILAAEVNTPHAKITELEQGRLDRLYQLLPPIEQIKDPKEKVEHLLQVYEQRSQENVMNAIDSMLPFDDVTMIYVDIDDTVEQGLARLTNLQTQLPNYIQENADLQNLLKTSNENTRLSDLRNVELEKRLEERTTEISNLEQTIQTQQEEIKQYQNTESEKNITIEKLENETRAQSKKFVQSIEKTAKIMDEKGAKANRRIPKIMAGIWNFLNNEK